MSRITNIYNKLEEYLLVGSLAFNVIIVLMQVIMRSVFNLSLSWTEELSRYIFIWQVWLGTSAALKYNEHIRVELIFTFIKNVIVQRIIKIAANIIWFAFCSFLCLNGWKLVQSMIGRHALSSGMRMPLAFVYIVLPLSALLVCIRLIPRIIYDIRHINSPVEEKGATEGGNA